MKATIAFGDRFLSFFSKSRREQIEKERIEKERYEIQCENAKIGEHISENALQSKLEESPKFKEIKQNYKFNASIPLENNKIRLIWWVNTENFGDLLSPWLLAKMTGHSVTFGKKKGMSYVGIGSILRRVENDSIVWGTGSFGPEPKSQISRRAKYHAVRGPLTRAKILDAGGSCPEFMEIPPF